MAQTLLYDGSFAGWLSAVFDAYYYKFKDVTICTQRNFKGNVFLPPHTVTTSAEHSRRVWQGLEKKLSSDALQQVHRTFLSELPDIETVLFHYVVYAFQATVSMETDYSHPAVLKIFQVAKKVWREMHRMQAFVRFQKTSDGLYYALIEPDYNVLPILADHFKNRYADQQWMIYDGKRHYGIYYDLHRVTEVEMQFVEQANAGKNIQNVYDEQEELYQQLWQRYFKSVNIAARKNRRLHLQHMPARYWKYLPEKKPSF